MVKYSILKSWSTQPLSRADNEVAWLEIQFGMDRAAVASFSFHFNRFLFTDLKRKTGSVLLTVNATHDVHFFELAWLVLSPIVLLVWTPYLPKINNLIKYRLFPFVERVLALSLEICYLETNIGIRRLGSFQKEWPWVIITLVRFMSDDAFLETSQETVKSFNCQIVFPCYNIWTKLSL